MILKDVLATCGWVFGTREGESTGAVGHIKAYPINGVGEKKLFLAKQGGTAPGTAKVVKLSHPNVLPLKLKDRSVIDCRSNVITSRKKSEWTGYHAEMIIVSSWIKLLYPGMTADKLTWVKPVDYQTKFSTITGFIVANAPCCKHCHNMLTYLGIGHLTPDPVKHSLTGWWNPLTDARFWNGSTDFNKAIPGI